MMGIERKFLGWDGACLRKAARWLCDRYGDGKVLDLSGVLVATPGGRANRRLLEILVEVAGEMELLPPGFTTVGGLPEQLYQPEVVAGELESELMRASVLREADARILEKVVAERPGDDDIVGWMRLAREFAAIEVTLAGAMLRVGEVVERCGVLVDFADEARWEALAALQAEYDKALEQRGMVSREMARFTAIEEMRCRTERDVVLVGMADMNELTRRMVEQAAGADGGKVFCLVHAPESEQAGFDEMGCLEVEAWHERNLPIRREGIRVVDRPNDQAGAVVEAVRDFALDQGEALLAADEVTIGLGDESLGVVIARSLDMAGAEARFAAGESVERSRPALLLGVIGQYLTRRRLDDFAAVVRHADMERYVAKVLGEEYSNKAVGWWLGLLDEYMTDHLSTGTTRNWLGDAGRAEALKRVHDAVGDLWEDDIEGRRGLSKWSGVIAGILSRVYGVEAMYRHRSEDEMLARAIEKIGDALREQAEMGDVEPQVSLPEAIGITLSRITGKAVAPAGGEGAIEMLGWLELQMDDGEYLVIAGVNEGKIPDSVNGDVFLPDGVRRVLGLTDNRKRYARDMMMMHAIYHSRKMVRLVSGRRTAENDPLKPSRLLLARDADELPEFVKYFYGEDVGHKKAGRRLLKAGGVNGFKVVEPGDVIEEMNELRVTAFKDYLACPYRFYLKYVLKLKSVDDRAVEMDAPAFGNVVHDVMLSFGRSEAAESTSESRIYEVLERELDAQIGCRYGKRPGAAVVIQRAQLAERLRGFAKWQARQAEEGWRIAREYLERPLVSGLEVDGRDFGITGRIDRIDQHPELGYRLLDYKTSDDGPEKVHRKGRGDSKQWIDLQLPLYRKLVEPLGLSGELALGYLLIGEKSGEDVLAPAEWDAEALASAEEAAKEVVRGIRGKVFWPPAKPAPKFDEYAELCMVNCLDMGDDDDGGES